MKSMKSIKSLTYQTKKNHLIVYCETKKLHDFFNNIAISSSTEKDFFVVPKEKERELIKILNYLNFVEKDGNPRFVNHIYDEEDEEDDEEVDSSYTSSEKEHDDDSSSYENESSSSYKNEGYEDDFDNKDINKFFKSFAHSDFIEKNKNEMKQKMMLQKSKDKVKDKVRINSDELKKTNQTKYQEDEYSSSSYNSSSSDNFPSPKTPKRRNNFSNEQLYTMIEKLEKKINLIQRVLEKKIL